VEIVEKQIIERDYSPLLSIIISKNLPPFANFTFKETFKQHVNKLNNLCKLLDNTAA
jgi:hypothetical protein